MSYEDVNVTTAADDSFKIHAILILMRLVRTHSMSDATIVWGIMGLIQWLLITLSFYQFP